MNGKSKHVKRKRKRAHETRRKETPETTEFLLLTRNFNGSYEIDGIYGSRLEVARCYGARRDGYTVSVKNKISKSRSVPSRRGKRLSTAIRLCLN